VPVLQWTTRRSDPGLSAHVKDDGTFVFEDVEPGRYRIHALLTSSQGGQTLVPSGEIDGPDDRVIVKIGADQRAKAHVTARLLREDGTPFVRASFIIEATQSSWVSAFQTGFVSSSAVPPGRYRLYAREFGEGQILDLGVRDIGATDIALGTLTFPPQGSVTLAWTRSGPPPGGEIRCSVFRVLTDGHRVTVVRDPPVELSKPTTVALSPGAYVLRVTGDDVQGAERMFEVRSGADAAVDVSLRAATKKHVRLRFPLAPPPIGRIRVTDDAGGFVHETLLLGPEFMVPLTPGRYRVDVDVTETITVSGTLDVPAANAPDVFDVRLE
jgi:hypothetical protein